MAKVALRPVLTAAVASILAGGLVLPTAPAVQAQSDPSVSGAWSAVQTWPTVSVHASLAKSGKVVFYSYGDDTRIWDPSSGSIVSAPKVGYEIFCSGLTLLADGRLFVGGGNTSNDVGVRYTSIYDPVTNTWSREANMNAGRWYPTTTSLADGSVLIVSGDIDTTVHANPLPQVWTNGVWRDLSTAQLQMALYPFMLLAPNGKVFNAGPEQTSRWLDTTGTGAWTNGPSSSGGFRDYGTAVTYEPGKVLMVGGNDPPIATAEKIDLNLLTPTWKPAGTMASARRQLNSTALPDGTVLITGGSSAAGFNTPSGAVYTAELWDPAQSTFTTLASATRYRGYHSIALLLPDGRVLSSGGDNEPNAEIFSPPYLFKGARPAVASAPTDISYGSSFFVQTSDATSVTAVTLVRLSAVTHAFNMNQRFLRLAFSQSAGGLTITAPAAGEIAPPGHYMLFLLNAAGVPSIARIVRVSNDGAPVPPAPTNLNASAASSSRIDLTWTDNASTETGFRVERSPDGSSFTEIAIVGANVTTYADNGLSASTQYWYRVRAYNGAGLSDYSNSPSATTQAAPPPPPQPPSAPAGLTATRQSGGFKLAWSDTSNNETGFAIQRSADGQTFSQIATVAAGVVTYLDTSPGTSKFVSYRVSAFNAAGTSAFSNTVRIRNR
jgi:galactose oxidase-like protein/glyoxal oxidase-like protein/fibronectin type III domain protein